MAIPAFLNSSYRFFERVGVSDVQTIMDDFAAEVLANDPPWTNPSGTLYKSPVDAAGRFFDVLLTRATQYQLEWRVRDQNAAVICTRRIVIPSVNSSLVRIFTGQFHAIVDVDTVTTSWEALVAGIVDLSPAAQSAHARYVYGGGSRDIATSRAWYWWPDLAMIDDATPTLATRCTTFNPAGTANLGKLLASGLRVHRPVELWAKPVGLGSQFRYAGRAYQQIIVGENYPWAEGLITLPIDAGVVGTFRNLGGRNAAFGKMLAVRVA